MTYVVYSGRSGFEATHVFISRDAAERFFNAEVEKIGEPVELVEQDGQGNQRTIVYTRKRQERVE